VGARTYCERNRDLRDGSVHRPDAHAPPGAPEWQLFDHLNDPLNQVNVSEQHPEVVERLQRLLADWQSYAEAARLLPDAESVEGTSAEELERLRSLGYIQ